MQYCMLVDFWSLILVLQLSYWPIKSCICSFICYSGHRTWACSVNYYSSHGRTGRARCRPSCGCFLTQREAGWANIDYFELNFLCCNCGFGYLKSPVRQHRGD